MFCLIPIISKEVVDVSMLGIRGRIMELGHDVSAIVSAKSVRGPLEQDTSALFKTLLICLLGIIMKKQDGVSPVDNRPSTD